MYSSGIHAAHGLNNCGRMGLETRKQDSDIAKKLKKQKELADKIQAQEEEVIHKEEQLRARREKEWLANDRLSKVPRRRFTHEQFLESLDQHYPPDA